MAPNNGNRRRGWALLVSMLVFFNIAQGQGIIVTGVVKDSSNGLPVSNVSVYFRNSHGVRTDSSGMYFLQSDQARSVIYSHKPCLQSRCEEKV